MPPPNAKPWFWKVLPDLVAFAAGLAIAYLLDWQTTDLVWSLWLCSLVLGYLTLLSGVAAAACGFIWAAGRPEVTVKQSGQILLIGGAIGLVILGFFSVHFCGFHAGHSVFLQAFFPKQGIPSDGFGAAFINPPLLWVLAFKHLMVPYGIFLIPAIIAERKHIFRPLIEVMQSVESAKNPGRTLDADSGETAPKVNKDVMRDFMGRPYLNVIRMHFLIFFFAFAHFAKLDSFYVYAAVYSVYFFPWSEIRNLRRQTKSVVGAVSAKG